MFLKLKKGDILSDVEFAPDTKVLVGYAKEGGNALFIIMEHGNSVLLSTSGDPEFNDTLTSLGIE